MNTSLRQVLLPESLCDAVEKRFGNLESFLTFVVGELLRDEAAALDQSEQHLVEERLRELGYL
jgi:hypothetical protein